MTPYPGVPERPSAPVQESSVGLSDTTPLLIHVEEKSETEDVAKAQPSRPSISVVSEYPKVVEHVDKAFVHHLPKTWVVTSESSSVQEVT